MAVLKAYGSMGSTLLKGVLAPIKEKGDEVEFEPIGMAARKKARYSSLDSFGEVPSVEEDGDFNLPGSNLKHEKWTGPVNVKALNILRPTVVVVPVCQIVKESMEKAGVLPKPVNVKAPNILRPAVVGVPVCLSAMEKAGVLRKLYPSCVSTVNLGVGSPSKYMGVESFDHVDSLQRHMEAKYCCRIGLSKCMGVDGFERSCVDVHACYKDTLPSLVPRGPRISKLSRTDTAAAAAAPAPSRPFSFRASLTVSLSVVFE